MAQNRKCRTKYSSTLYHALSTSGINRSCACGAAPSNRKPTTTMPKGARATHRNSKNSRTLVQKQPSAVAAPQPKNRASRSRLPVGAAGTLLDIVCLPRFEAQVAADGAQDVFSYARLRAPPSRHFPGRERIGRTLQNRRQLRKVPQQHGGHVVVVDPV